MHRAEIVLEKVSDSPETPSGEFKSFVKAVKLAQGFDDLN